MQWPYGDLMTRVACISIIARSQRTIDAHGVGLAGAGLSVRQQRGVEACQELGDQLRAARVPDVLLCRICSTAGTAMMSGCATLDPSIMPTIVEVLGTCFIYAHDAGLELASIMSSAWDFHTANRKNRQLRIAGTPQDSTVRTCFRHLTNKSQTPSLDRRYSIPGARTESKKNGRFPWPVLTATQRWRISGITRAPAGDTVPLIGGRTLRDSAAVSTSKLVTYRQTCFERGSRTAHLPNTDFKPNM